MPLKLFPQCDGENASDRSIICFLFFFFLAVALVPTVERSSKARQQYYNSSSRLLGVPGSTLTKQDRRLGDGNPVQLLPFPCQTNGQGGGGMVPEVNIATKTKTCGLLSERDIREGMGKGSGFPLSLCLNTRRIQRQSPHRFTSWMFLRTSIVFILTCHERRST